MARGLLVLVVALIAGVISQSDRDFNPRFRPLPDPDQTVSACRQKEADVFFVLDASSSIYIEEYELQRQFVREIINRLDISHQYTRVGAVTYSDNYRVSFDLGDFSDKQNLRNAVNTRNLPYLTGVTNTAEAIRYVRTNGKFRPEVTRVIIVVTDGYSRAPASTRSEADTARTEGFYLFVIGVGQYTDEREWRAIANDPDQSYIFNITNYQALERLYNEIPNRLCPLPPIIINSETCFMHEDADLIFVAGPREADNAFSMVSNLINALRDDRAHLRLSLLLGSCRASEIPLSDPSLFCNNFGDPNPSRDSYTNLLKDMRAEARDARGSRPRANQVAILFIDEQSMNLDRFGIWREAQDAQRDGIQVYVVDLGVINNRNFLSRIGSGADAVLSTTGTSVRQVEKDLLDKACDSLNERQIIFPSLPPPSK